MCDLENVFYCGYRSTFEKQFPADSGLERFKIDIRVEQHAVICFYVRLGKSSEADMKKAYDSECLNKTTVNLWHKSYRDGRDFVGLGPRGGTKKSVITEVNINTVATVIQEDRHVSVRLLKRQLNIPKSTIHWILTEHLGMCHIPFT